MYVSTGSTYGGASGLGDLAEALGMGRSPTMRLAQNQERVLRAKRASGGWYSPVPSPGVSGLADPCASCLGGGHLGAAGQTFWDKIPSWVPWGLGGLVVGGVAGYLLLK